MRSHVARTASGFQIAHLVVRCLCSAPLPVLVVDNQTNNGIAHDAAVSIPFEHGIPQAGIMALFPLNLRHLIASTADIPIVFLCGDALKMGSRVLRGVAPFAKPVGHVANIGEVAGLTVVEVSRPAVHGRRAKHNRKTLSS
jgi:hypothetical protein